MAQYKQLSATTQLTRELSKLTSITVSSTSSGTITIYDTPDGDTSNDPKVLETLTPSAGAHFYFGEDGLSASKGLYIVIANTLQVTIGYKGNP